MKKKSITIKLLEAEENIFINFNLVKLLDMTPKTEPIKGKLINCTS